MTINRQFIGSALIDPTVKAVLRSLLSKLVEQGAPVAKTTSVTLTAAEVIPPSGGLITGNQGGAAAATYTMPTGASLDTALLAVNSDLAVGDSFRFSIVNLSTVAAEVLTLAANTGVTVAGDLTMAAITAGDQSSGTFLVRRTGAGTYTVHRV